MEPLPQLGEEGRRQTVRGTEGTLPGVSNLSSLTGTLPPLSTGEETEAQRRGAACPRMPSGQGGAERAPWAASLRGPAEAWLLAPQLAIPPGASLP